MLCQHAGTSDLVGQLVGAFASTAMVWQAQRPLDTTYYNTLMTAATSLYGAGVYDPKRPLRGTYAPAKHTSAGPMLLLRA